MILFHQLKIAWKVSHERGQSIRRRLILYMLSLCLLLVMISCGCMVTLGHFSKVEQMIHSQLSTQLSLYEKDITTHYDNVAARGIQLSQSLSSQIEGELKNNGLNFANLNNNSNAINRMEDSLYDTLYQSMLLTDCSGGFFLLNATVNTQALSSGNSNCGLYLKVANVKVKKPVSPKIVLFRGSTFVGKNRGIDCHNKWALEFNTANFPNYEFLMKQANQDLNSCYLFTPIVELPDTWEKVMLLCVPIVGSDGTVYGMCGFEISSIYYKILHEQPATIKHLTGFLCEQADGKLLITQGLESGGSDGYFAGMSAPSLSVQKTHYFNRYQSKEGDYIGLDREVRISPLNHDTVVAVMIPRTDFDKANSQNILQTIFTILLLVAVAVLGCFWVSYRYVAPILEGLQTLKDKDTEHRKTNIIEIDDLLAFLSLQDERSEAEIESLRQALAHVSVETNAYQRETASARQSSYEEFVQGISTLSTAEKAVFDLYLKGYTAKEITEILCLSINTIKTHNKRIFMKLNVTSRKELMVYVQMMKEKEGNDSED